MFFNYQINLKLKSFDPQFLNAASKKIIDIVEGYKKLNSTHSVGTTLSFKKDNNFSPMPFQKEEGKSTGIRLKSSHQPFFYREPAISQNSGRTLSYKENQCQVEIKRFRLPTTKTLYTVIRSPHIDKKSREQYFFKIHSIGFQLNFKNLLFTQYFIFLLQNSKFPGIEMEIEVTYCTPTHIKQIDNL